MTGRRITVIRFAMVGAGVAALYVVLYLLFLAAGLVQVAANGLAFLLAVAAQYFGQAAFTFNAPLAERAQIARFGAMIGAGLVTSALVTGLFAPLAGLPHWLAAILVTVILPVQNYLLMSRWVFPGRVETLEKIQ